MVRILECVPKPRIWRTAAFSTDDPQDGVKDYVKRNRDEPGDGIVHDGRQLVRKWQQFTKQSVMVKIGAVERYKHATAWLHSFDECFKCGPGFRRDHQDATRPNNIKTLILEWEL